MTVNENIIDLIRELNISPTDFAREVGASRQVVNNIVNNINRPNIETIGKILTRYNNLSERWLILSEGEKWKGNLQYDSQEKLQTASEPESKYQALNKDAQFEILQKENEFLKKEVEYHKKVVSTLIDKIGVKP